MKSMSRTCPARVKSTASAVAPSDTQVRLITPYIDAAMRRVIIERLEDGIWYAEVAELPGVWSDGRDPAACLEALKSVIEEWIVLKLRNGDADFPTLDDIDLNPH